MSLVENDPPCGCCPKPKVNIPEGVLVLEQVCGEENGLMDSGAYWCYCPWKSIKCVISKNTIRFRCPVLQVPTKGDVMVDVDVGVIFRIGGSQETYAEDAKKFYYNFGPNRLEELLCNECDEGVRDFVRKTKVQRIVDIKSEMTAPLALALQKKFEPYGVYIE